MAVVNYTASLLVLMASLAVLPVVSADIELWRTYCPVSKYCTTEGLMRSNDSVVAEGSCCPLCSCDEKCWSFDNCCPDVTHAKPADLRTAECINPSINSQYLIGRLPGLIYSYTMINFCPTDYDVTKNKNVIEKCEGQMGNYSSFDEVVVVADEDDRLYRNKFCALCHGVEEVESWDLLLITCRNDLMMKTILGPRYEETVLQYCMLEAIPSNRMLGKRNFRRCDVKYLSHCPSRGGPYRADIRDECLNGPTVPFAYLPDPTIIQLYKNVFCYMCNKGDKTTNNCSKTIGVLPGRSTAFGLSVLLLDMSVAKDLRGTPDVTLDPKCDETEAFDRFKTRCLRLYCPPFSILSRGRCMKMGAFNDGFGVRLNIEYLLKHDITVTDDFKLSENKQALQRRLLRHYGLELCQVPRIGLGGFVEKKSSRLAFIRVLLELEFNRDCAVDDSIRAIRDHVSRNTITLATSASNVTLTGKLSFNVKADVYDEGQLEMRELMGDLSIPKVIVVDTTFAMDQSTKFLSDFFLCPFFVFTAEEYESLVNTTVKPFESKTRDYAFFEKGSYAISNNTHAVCTDTYFELYVRSSGHWYGVKYITYVADWLVIYLISCITF